MKNNYENELRNEEKNWIFSLVVNPNFIQTIFFKLSVHIQQSYK